MFKLLTELSVTNIPTTFIGFPLLTEDSQYLYSKLFQLVNKIEFNTFNSVFKEVVNPELVHDFSNFTI